MQVGKQDAGFGRTTDPRVSLLLKQLLFLLFLVSCAGDRIKFGLEATVGDSVVLDLDQVLEVVLVFWAFNFDRAALHLHNPIILDVDFAREALKHGLKPFLAVLRVIHLRLSRQHFVP